jgi:hypothetical protein
MIYARKQLPKYCRHKSSGRAFVRIGGKMYYLGKHGSQASRRKYDRIIAEFSVRSCLNSRKEHKFVCMMRFLAEKLVFRDVLF